MEGSERRGLLMMIAPRLIEGSERVGLLNYCKILRGSRYPIDTFDPYSMEGSEQRGRHPYDLPYGILVRDFGRG